MKTNCGCCTGIEVVTPEPEENRPGLPAISYRVGDYGAFFESMVARLSTLALDVPASDSDPSVLQRIFPLRRLTTREASDPSIALLDAWAIVGDVLTFYEERIANEGYLRTATEHRSVLELAALVGYRLRPAISASVYLAFTVADGFNGAIPAGARAQSIPGPGEQPQFFETSIDLPARDVWNTLSVRTTRPQTITFTDDPTTNETEGTDAATRDTLYFQGLTTNLNAGDYILVVGNDEASQAKLRRIISVDVQSTESRTLVVLEEPRLVLPGPTLFADAQAAFQPYIDEASSIFGGVDLAGDVAAVLTTLLADIKLVADANDAMNLVVAVQAQVQAWHDLAASRHFTRLEPWLAGLLSTMQEFNDELIASLTSPAMGALARSFSASAVAPPPPLASLQDDRPSSPLSNLTNILGPLTQLPSVQPANSLRLPRTVAQTFTRQSDIAPRLLASLYPRAASTLYQAWGGAESPAAQVTVSAVRTKAGLFANTSSGLPVYDGNNRLTGFSGVSISPAWGALTDGSSPLAVIALDSAYDKIQAGDWIAVARPNLSAAGTLTTYHQVTAATTVTMTALANPPSAGGLEATEGATATTAVPFGFSAKSTQLTVDPPWLSELNSDGVAKALNSGVTLQGTVVYAQAEELDLAEEPLDIEVEGGAIELAGLYDGLDTGRWIIVSGERTDIPNTTGVIANELVMIASVTQGSRSVLSVDFPSGLLPFSSIAYITDANASGDRLAVGTPAASIAGLALPAVPNQQFSDEVQLAPGFYASAYVPTAAERGGNFSNFIGLLVDPITNEPIPGGIIPASRLGAVFAWRLSTEPVHTTLTLANVLSYTYDPASVTIYANVVQATNGQTTGEVLGNGDASQSLQTFGLGQSPLTYLPAVTPFGAQDTLTVRVNEVAWTEADNLVALGPRDRDYILKTDDSDKVSVIFGTGTHGTRVPTGNGNVKATYRFGSGSSGNVDALQISQLATQPLGVKAVINPQASSGGADGDTTDQARRNIPTAVLSLDRLVSVQDYADFSRAYAGIAKSSSTLISDGRRTTVHLTVAGNGDITIDPASDLYRSLVQALLQYGDPSQPLEVASRGSQLLVIAAAVKILPAYTWESVAPALRSALLSLFSFDTRELGQSAFLSEAIAAMQAVDGVQYVNVTTFDSVADTVTASQLAALASTLRLKHVVRAQLARIDPTQTDPTKRILPAQLVTLTPDIPDTLILTEVDA